MYICDNIISADQIVNVCDKDNNEDEDATIISIKQKKSNKSKKKKKDDLDVEENIVNDPVSTEC